MIRGGVMSGIARSGEHLPNLEGVGHSETPHGVWSECAELRDAAHARCRVRARTGRLHHARVGIAPLAVGGRFVGAE